MNVGTAMAAALAAAGRLPGPGAGLTVEGLLLELAKVGPVGAVCVWLMWRVETKLTEQAASTERLRQAINRLAMSHLLEVASREDAPNIVKLQAKALIDEIKTEQAVEQAKAGGGREGFLP